MEVDSNLPYPACATINAQEGIIKTHNQLKAQESATASLLTCAFILSNNEQLKVKQKFLFE